jgi:hypothetical protein
LPSAPPTLGEALAAYQRAHRLDPSPATAASWTFKFGPLTLRLPNFAWRREAILRHDLHHVLTGYDCTMRGECQMATWEFAAGRFPHPGATLFCLPLVAAGLVWSPRAIWSAFRRGRSGCSLYGVELTDTLLRTSPSAVIETVRRLQKRTSPAGDIVAFAWLVVKAGLMVAVPFVVVTTLALWCF